MIKLTGYLAIAAFMVVSSTASYSELLVFEGKDGPGKGKHIVLISGDEEYRSEEVMPMLGKLLSQHHGFKCTVLFSIDPTDGYIDANNQKNLPGLEALNSADLMIVATRFRTPSEEQMKPFDAYLNAGKPVIGLRTATHGFRGKWGFFGRQILGEQWAGHHGGHKREGCRGVVDEKNANHPVLNGVEDVFAPSDVYGTRNLDLKTATVLLKGAVTKTLDPKSPNVEGKKNEPMQSLAWIRDYKSPGGGKGKAFCTTMGASVDLVSEGSRRLVVNAAIHLTGLEVPKKANVEFVDPYYPSFYGFWKAKNREDSIWYKRKLKPSDFGLGKAPVAVDPPGTPKWPFREMGPKK